MDGIEDPFRLKTTSGFERDFHKLGRAPATIRTVTPFVPDRSYPARDRDIPVGAATLSSRAAQLSLPRQAANQRCDMFDRIEVAQSYLLLPDCNSERRLNVRNELRYANGVDQARPDQRSLVIIIGAFYQN